MRTVSFKYIPYIIHCLALAMSLGYIGFGINYGHELVHYYVSDAAIYTLYFSNYFYFTPRIFNNGFSARRLLLLACCFVFVYIGFFAVRSIYLGWMTSTVGLFSFIFLNLQSAIHFWMMSTGAAIVKMLANNKLTIRSLTSKNKQLELQGLQAALPSDLVLNYIQYLKEEIKTNSISDRIVAMADFLRYQTYGSKKSFSTLEEELGQLRLYEQIFKESRLITFDVQTENIEETIQIAPFALVGPIKELMEKSTVTKDYRISIQGGGDNLSLEIPTEECSENLTLLEYQRARVSYSTKIPIIAH